MKKCTKCQSELPLESFHSNSAARKTLRAICGPCEIAKRKEYRQRRKLDPEFSDKSLYHRQRKILDDAKSVPCMDCGILHSPYIMDFDHRDGAEKLFNVSSGFKRAKHIVLAEIAKCDIVCSNCHRYRTYERRGAKRGVVNAAQ
jgi:hypothetical protein